MFPSFFLFKQQLEDAFAEDEDSEYHEILRTLRTLYPHGRTESDLRIIAFIRRDRFRTERIASALAEFNPDAALHASSPAAALADYGENEA